MAARHAFERRRAGCGRGTTSRQLLAGVLSARGDEVGPGRVAHTAGTRTRMHSLLLLVAHHTRVIPGSARSRLTASHATTTQRTASPLFASRAATQRRQQNKLYRKERRGSTHTQKPALHAPAHKGDDVASTRSGLSHPAMQHKHAAHVHATPCRAVCAASLQHVR